MKLRKLLKMLVNYPLSGKEQEEIKQQIIYRLKQGAKTYEEVEEVREFICGLDWVMTKWWSLRELTKEASQYLRKMFNDTFGLDALKFNSEVESKYKRFNGIRFGLLFEKLKNGEIDEETLDVLEMVYLAVEDIRKYNDIIGEVCSILYEAEVYIINNFFVELDP